MARVVLPFGRGNGLRYPGGLPGFDPAHVALSSGGPPRFSVVARPGGASLVNLLNGGTGTNSGGTAVIEGTIGPAIKYGSAGNNTTFAVPAISDPAITLAAIFRIDTNTAFGGIFGTSSTSSGWYLCLGGSSTLTLGVDGGSNTGLTNFNAVVGHTYFAVASTNSTTTNNVVVDLTTGQTWAGVTTFSLTTSASSGTGGLGCFNGKNPATTVAAVTAIPAFQPIDKLLRFAADPWSFWYPQTFDLASMLKPAAAAGGRGLFINSPLTGLGAGGSFFPDRLAS